MSFVASSFSDHENYKYMVQDKDGDTIHYFQSKNKSIFVTALKGSFLLGLTEKFCFDFGYFTFVSLCSNSTNSNEVFTIKYEWNYGSRKKELCLKSDVFNIIKRMDNIDFKFG